MNDEFSTLITSFKAQLQTALDSEDYESVLRAYELFRETELNQNEVYRKVYVASLALSEANLKAKALIALFLYEAINTEIISKEIIKNNFDSKVLVIIDGLIKIFKIKPVKSEIHSENFIKLLLSQADDVRVILLLLVQKLYYVRIIQELESQEIEILCKELSSLYAPLAHRLGLYKMKTEMEEISMKYLHNDIYKSIAKKLAETKSERDTYIEEFIKPIKSSLDKEGISYTIKGRPKSIHSIWNKLKKNDAKFESIYDLFAIRIILDSLLENEKADCWHVYSIVSDIYRPNPNRLRDWISAPKLSGYESLHTTVIGPEGKWVEIQIRTTRMDDVAENGHAAHWRYKEGGESAGSEGWLTRMKAALENPQESDIESSSRIELYSDEIFVFTPNGDLKKLVKGATVIDFAYDVHTNIGSTCIGGKVNGKIVPIKHTLNNGDQIEILTSKSQTPKRDWLHFAKSARVRSKIKKYLKESEHQNAEEGKEIVKRKLAQVKVKFGDESVYKIIKHYKAKDALDLYLKAVEEKIDWAELKLLFSPDKNEDDKKPNQINAKDFTKNLVRKIDSGDNFLILEDNIDNIDYRLGKCCKPIKGDDVFGFVTASGGVTIHRLNCPNAYNMMEKYPYRIVKTSWTEYSHDSKFLVGIKVVGVDEIGIISTITQVISQDMKVNMRDITVVSNDDTFEGKMTLYINDNKHLDNLLKKIRTIKGVHSVGRFNMH